MRGAKGLEPLAFWMQTIFFACSYVAGRGLTGRLPAEIVADCRRASPWVWLRWLFGPSFWLGVPDLWRSGFDTHNISAGSGDRFSVRVAAKKQQVKVPILVVWLLPCCLPRPSSGRLQKLLEHKVPPRRRAWDAVSCCRIERHLWNRWPAGPGGFATPCPHRRRAGLLLLAIAATVV
jgi:hypothetical protein